MEEYFAKIDKIYEKSDLGLNYDFLQMIVENVVNHYIENKNPEYEVFYDLSDSIEICLEFAKTLGKDYYDLFIKTLFDDKVIMFEKKDTITDKIVGTDGFPLKNCPCFHYNNSETDYRIYIPITYTIEDIYTILHEITHAIKFNSRDNLSENIFREISSFTIEKILSKYLIETKSEKAEIIKYDINNHNGVFYNALDSLYAITFTNIKKKLGKITFDNFSSYTNNIKYFKYYIDLLDVKEYIENVKTNTYNYLFYLRYVIAQLISINLISKDYTTKQIMKILSDFNNNTYTNESFVNAFLYGIPNNEINDKLKILKTDINSSESISKTFDNYKEYTKKLIKEKNNVK